MSEIPEVKIERYENPEERSILSLEPWEVYTHGDDPERGFRICVHTCTSTGLPYVASFQNQEGEAECMFNDIPITVVGRLVFG